MNSIAINRKRKRQPAGMVLTVLAAALLLADPVAAQDGDAPYAEWSDGTLWVVGTSGPDQLSIASRDGLIEVNGGRIPVIGGVPTLSGTTSIAVQGLGGNDHIVLNQWESPLPSADLDGGEGNDLLIGGDGADVLRGGAGNDTLLGNRGNDVVLGQDGNDLLIVNNGDGSDFLEGGQDTDTVQIYGSDSDRDSIQVYANGDQVLVEGESDNHFEHEIETTEVLRISGGGGDDDISGSDGLADLISLEFHGGLGFDILTGGDGDDVLSGEEGRDIIIANGGNDFVDGGKGDDELRGGEGDDQLFGGSGNDVLLGDRGNDRVEGQDGSDLLIVNNGDGSDFLEGGEGLDTVQVNGDNADNEIDIRAEDSGVVVESRTGGIYQVTVTISEAETLDVNGKGGSDVIIGSLGFNGLISMNLSGGRGNDILLAGDGNDTLDGGPGRDFCNGNGGDDQFKSCESIR